LSFWLPRCAGRRPVRCFICNNGCASHHFAVGVTYVGAGSPESDSFVAKLFLREQAVDKTIGKIVDKESKQCFLGFYFYHQIETLRIYDRRGTFEFGQ
jgi:hypothetical protein